MMIREQLFQWFLTCLNEEEYKPTSDPHQTAKFMNPFYHPLHATAMNLGYRHVGTDQDREQDGFDGFTTHKYQHPKGQTLNLHSDSEGEGYHGFAHTNHRNGNMTLGSTREDLRKATNGKS